jgi:hypothetical protein
MGGAAEGQDHRRAGAGLAQMPLGAKARADAHATAGRLILLLPDAVGPVFSARPTRIQRPRFFYSFKNIQLGRLHTESFVWLDMQVGGWSASHVSQRWVFSDAYRASKKA